MDHIHTIPVLDALRDPQGCAFCVMHKKLEEASIQFMLSPAYMEDDVRMETNRIGFCKRHLNAMYEEQNRLGLALMLHTHMQQLNKDTGGIIKGRLPSPLFKKDANGVLPRLKAHLDKTHASCYICRKVESTFERYIDTFFHLWNKRGDEAKLIAAQTGYCMPHFIELLSAAERQGRGNRERFIDEILPVWQKMTQELEEDLDWFVQKFDHRNADEPWKNSKDALPRALAVLGGKG